MVFQNVGGYINLQMDLFPFRMAQHLEQMQYMLVTKGSNLWVPADDNVSLPDIGVEPSHYALETVFPMSCDILNAYSLNNVESCGI